MEKGLPMEPNKRSGRPKKAESEKVKYQRIAVYLSDYEKLAEEVERRKLKEPKFKLLDAFKEMVADYTRT